MKARETTMDEVLEWKTRVDGVLVILKWMGMPGVVALLWVALRAFGKLP